MISDRLAPAVPTPPTPFERYIVQGTVVDESGTPVDGAALEVGSAAIFTDSRGRFFHRLSSTRAVPVRVMLDEFLATGRFEVVTAPATATPRIERESTPIRIVVRRVPQTPPGPPPRTDDATPNE